MSPTESTVDIVQDKVEDLVKHDVDSVDSNVRYLAYGARLRTALTAGSRYIAYVSLIDIVCPSECSKFQSYHVYIIDQ